MPLKAFELPCALALGSCWLSSCVRGSTCSCLVLISVYYLKYSSLFIHLLIFLLEIFWTILQEIPTLSRFNLDLCIIMWLGRARKFLEWPEMKLFVFTDCSGSWDTHLHAPAKCFTSVTLVHRLWSIVDHIGSLPRNQMPCVICIIITTDLHIV